MSFHRVPSSLDRSMELLSMESELHDLLNNSSLSQTQKQAFEEMLTATFDLLQSPLQRENSQGKASLIDSSSIALYSKMQELVSSLAALIMEEDHTRMDITRLDMNDLDDSTEFSDGDGDVRAFELSPPQRAVTTSQRHDVRRRSVFTPSSSSGTPRLSSKKLYLDGLVHQSSRESLRSPSFNSPKLPPFYEKKSQQHDYTGRLQVMNTPVPRSFSYSQQSPVPHPQRQVSGQRSRPTSMYIWPSAQRSYAYEDVSTHGSRRNSSYGSQSGTPSQRKRYSMRF